MKTIYIIYAIPDNGNGIPFILDRLDDINGYIVPSRILKDDVQIEINVEYTEEKNNCDE